MALREILAHFGIDVDTEELEKANKSIDNFIGRLKELGTAVVGGEFAKQVFEFGERIAEQGDQLEKASIRLGISTDSLQALGYAAVQSGSDMGQLTFALLTLQDKIGDALINKTGEGAKTFAKLGISIRGANGEVKDAGDLLSDVADRIGKAHSQAEKTAIAMEVFGRQGKSLLPLLEGGSEGLAKLREEFASLGGGMRENAIKAAAQYTTTLGKLHVVHDGLIGQIGVVLLPVLDRMIDVITKAEREMINLANNSSLVATVIGGMGAVLTVFAVKSAIAFAPWLLWAAALAAVVLIAEDVVTMFRGGDSLLGRFLDTVGGKNFHVEVVKEMRDEWANLRDVFKELGPVFHEFVEELRWIFNFGKAVAHILGEIGGGIGDAAGRAHNYLVNKGVVSGGPTINGGMSNDTNSAMVQAGLMNNAFAHGDTSFSPSETPKFYADRGAAGKDEWLDMIKRWADFLKQQKQTMLSSSGLGMAPGMGVFNQKNEINVHDATDPHKVAKVVHSVIKERHAAAAQVLHKKAEPK